MKFNLRSVLWLLICLLAVGLNSIHQTKILTGLAFVLWGLAFWYDTHRFGFISGPSIFIFILGLFHLGMVVPVTLLGLKNLVYPDILSLNMQWLTSEHLDIALELFVIGVAAYQIGIGWKGRRGRITLMEKKYLIFRNKIAARIWTAVAIVTGMGYFITGILQGILFHERTVYLYLKATNKALLFGIFHSLMIISTIVAIAFSNRRRALLLAVGLLLALSPMFISGKRGEFLVILASLVIILRRKGIRLKGWLEVAGLILVFPLITILRQIRHGEEWFGVWWLDPALEMGQQLKVVVFTVSAIKDGLTTFWYGASYLEGFLRVIPNVAGIRGNYGIISPSTWITMMYNPNGAGLGYSIIAEPYINFGLIGVFVIMWLLGLLMRRMEEGLVGGRNPYKMAVYGSMLYSLLWAIRNDSFVVFRPLIWTILGLLITKVVTGVSGSLPRGHFNVCNLSENVIEEKNTN